MENHHFLWENSLFLWAIFNSYVELPEGTQQENSFSAWPGPEPIRRLPRKAPRHISIFQTRRQLGHLQVVLWFDQEEVKQFDKQNHYNFLLINSHVGVSENSVPLNPMVNDHYPY